MQSTSKEFILGPAVQIISPDGKTAKILTLALPHDHGDISPNDIFFNNVKVTNVTLDIDPGVRTSNGYYTNLKPFVNRMEAMTIAREADQLLIKGFKGEVLYTFLLIDLSKRNLK